MLHSAQRNRTIVRGKKIKNEINDSREKMKKHIEEELKASKVNDSNNKSQATAIAAAAKTNITNFT